MKTAIIADDEPNLAEHLRAQLATLAAHVEVIGIAHNGVDALALISGRKPDLAFLDIRMPGLTGLEVARATPASTRVIFVTAFDQYAIEAFDAAAADYLLKPVGADRLRACVERLERQEPRQVDLAGLLEQLQQSRPQYLRWLRVGASDTTRLVAVEDVLYFRSDSKYTVAATVERDELLRTSLRELEGQLDPDWFWRINRGLIVNVRAIDQARRDLRGRYRLTIRGRPEVLRTSEAYAHLFRHM